MEYGKFLNQALQAFNNTAQANQMPEQQSDVDALIKALTEQNKPNISNYNPKVEAKGQDWTKDIGKMMGSFIGG